jgi:hypothetical protein
MSRRSKRNRAAARFGREPILTPRDCARGRALTVQPEKPHPLDKAEEVLRMVRLKEPIWQANIEDAFAGMTAARAKYRRAKGETP